MIGKELWTSWTVMSEVKEINERHQPLVYKIKKKTASMKKVATVSLQTKYGRVNWMFIFITSVMVKLHRCHIEVTDSTQMIF